MLLKNCKSDEKQEEDISGIYEFTFTGYSYWCDKTINSKGEDSFILLGYYTFTNQPFSKTSEAQLTKISQTKYKICLDTRSNCDSPQFYSYFTLSNDSIDFGNGFNVFSEITSVIHMKGIRQGNVFKGRYTRYTVQEIPTSSNPHDHIYICDFELKRK